eukprot:scaffold16627_cov93-Cyclotella_meneghiniana.AAC.4
MSAKTPKHNNTSYSRDNFKDLVRRIDKNEFTIMEMMNMLQQSIQESRQERLESKKMQQSMNDSLLQSFQSLQQSIHGQLQESAQRQQVQLRKSTQTMQASIERHTASMERHIISIEQSVTTAVTMPLPNKVESITAVELSVETISEDEATLEQESTIAQKVPFLHADSKSAMARPFLVPPDSYPTKSQTHYPPTSNTSTIKWIPNLDGWMMLHDLKGWMKIHFLMGWMISSA